jgi:hypothetical protein
MRDALTSLFSENKKKSFDCKRRSSQGGVMKFIWFIFYYLSLRVRVLFRLHRTDNPLDIKWRWKRWRQRDMCFY